MVSWVCRVMVRSLFQEINLIWVCISLVYPNLLSIDFSSFPDRFPSNTLDTNTYEFPRRAMLLSFCSFVLHTSILSLVFSKVIPYFAELCQFIISASFIPSVRSSLLIRTIAFFCTGMMGSFVVTLHPKFALCYYVYDPCHGILFLLCWSCKCHLENSLYVFVILSQIICLLSVAFWWSNRLSWATLGQSLIRYFLVFLVWNINFGWRSSILWCWSWLWYFSVRPATDVWSSYFSFVPHLVFVWWILGPPEILAQFLLL